MKGEGSERGWLSVREGEGHGAKTCLSIQTFFPAPLSSSVPNAIKVSSAKTPKPVNRTGVGAEVPITASRQTLDSLHTIT
jgi:hypothetical protein